jgi:uncharacterized protein
MPSSDVEIVRAAFAAFGRGDVDAVLANCDPEIVVRDPARTGQTFRGREDLRRFWDEWFENWDEYRVEPQEFVEAGGEILVRARQVGRGKLSGIEIDDDLYQVFRVRNGRLVEYRLYTEREDAVASMPGSE